MTRQVHRTAAYLLFVFSIAWPWDVYQYIPWLGGHVTGLAGAGLVALLILDLATKHDLRMPFELIWPAGLLTVCVVLSLLGNAPGLSGAHLGALFVFVATVHFARSREGIERWVYLSCLSATGVALCTSIALITPLVPTAYSLESTAVLAFSRDLTGGTLTLLVFLLIAVHLLRRTLRANASRFQTLVAGLPPSLLAIVLVIVVTRTSHAGVLRLWQPPELLSLSLVTAAALLTLLWLAARVMAKLEVARQAAAANLDMQATPRMLRDTIGVAAVFCLCFPVGLTVAHGFLLGLAAAYALPAKQPRLAISHWRFALLAPCAALIVFNVFHVHPDNRADPRNYDVAARADFEARRFAALARRMDVIKTFAPDERRTHLWRARMELAMGYPHSAAHQFGQAVRYPANLRQILPPPSDAEQRDFLVRLRDFCSWAPKPERMLAYEQALVAAGRADVALDSLRHRVYARGKPELTLPAEPFAEAVAFLLRDAALVKSLGGLSPAELLLLLKQWGAVVDRAPDDFPRDLLPVVLVAQARPAAIALRAQAGVAAPATARVAPKHALARPGDPATGWGEAGWAPLAPFDSGYLTELRLPGGGRVAEVRFGPNGTCTCIPSLDPHGVAPDLPAIRVCIP